MWKILNLTTASDTVRVSFSGRGSIYAEGTFGSGTVRAHAVAVLDTGVKLVSTGYIDDEIDGTTIKSFDVPSGDYELELNGSTGGDVDIWCNDQAEHTINR